MNPTTREEAIAALSAFSGLPPAAFERMTDEVIFDMDDKRITNPTGLDFAFRILFFVVKQINKATRA